MNEEKIRNQPLTACKRHSPAAGGQERALEAISVDGKTIENGAFTYSILECLKQNEGKELKVNTLKQYAEKRVDGSGLGGEVEVFLTSGYENSLPATKGQTEEELVQLLTESITAEIERLDKRDEKCKNKKK